MFAFANRPDRQFLESGTQCGKTLFELNVTDPGVDVSTDGTFTFGTVREGRYHLWVQDLPAGLYIEAVRYGGKDVLGSGLVIDGAVPQLLEVVISGPPGGIEGVVRDAKGEPVPDTNPKLSCLFLNS